MDAWQPPPPGAEAPSEATALLVHGEGWARPRQRPPRERLRCRRRRAALLAAAALAEDEALGVKAEGDDDAVVVEKTYLEKREKSILVNKDSWAYKGYKRRYPGDGPAPGTPDPWDPELESRRKWKYTLNEWNRGIKFFASYEQPEGCWVMDLPPMVPVTIFEKREKSIRMMKASWAYQGYRRLYPADGPVPGTPDPRDPELESNRKWKRARNKWALDIGDNCNCERFEGEALMDLPPTLPSEGPMYIEDGTFRFSLKKLLEAQGPPARLWPGSDVPPGLEELHPDHLQNAKDDLPTDSSDSECGQSEGDFWILQ